MKPNAIFHPGADEWTELVFEHRNKSYGAYELRRMYNRRLQQSLLTTVGGLALLFLLLFKFSSTQTTDIFDTSDDVVSVSDIANVATPKSKPVSSTPPTRSRKSFTSNVVVADVDSTTAAPDTTSHQGDTGTNNNNQSDSVSTGSGGNNLAKDTTTNDNNKIQLFAEVMPEFPGGMEALMKYLSKHINCSLWRESGESGQVVFSLVVGKDGSVSDIEVLRDGVGYGCAEQATQVIRNMPKWKPGMQGDRPVNVKYVLPVTYLKQ